MRYYNIEITKPDGSPFKFASMGNLALTSLLPTGPQNPMTGQANPAALNIEFDIPVVVLNDPDNNAWLRIWGLGLQDIGTASNLNNMGIAIYAGMSKGLPLANPAQAGLLMKGKVLYAFGNWVGTDQTIEMNFIPSSGTGSGGSSLSLGSPADPANFPFSWDAGEPLATAIKNTLSVAMPGVTQQINISPRLVLNYAVTGWYQSAQQFADFIDEISWMIIGGNYNGVSITTDGQTVRVFDGTAPSSSSGTSSGSTSSSTSSGAAKQIAFQDLIGQPTWVGPATLSVKTVMRADIHMGDTITLPPSLVTVTSAAAPYLALADKTSFSGSYSVIQAHYYGNFRQPTADSWNTTFQVTPVASSSPQPAAS